jgi:phthalate 4,5-cis-dihydrodiol dehydrogenase
MMTGQRKLGLGIVGLGGAAVNMLPFFWRSAFEIVGVADTDPVVRGRFVEDFPGTRGYGDVDQLCADPDVHLVYIGTPTRLHSEHARAALERGKHVLIEKPMAVTLKDAEEMIRTAERNGVLLGVNVKHSFEPRIQKIRALIRSGELGAPRMIQNWRYVSWLYQPRAPEELAPGWGNGLLWRQGPHQFDIIRTIGGGLLRSLRGMTGTWDPARKVPGAYTVYFEFENGIFGSAMCAAYDHFDSRDLVRGFDGAAPLVDPARHAKARRELLAHDAAWEHEQAASERYGGGRKHSAKPTSEKSAAPKPPAPSMGWVMSGPLVVSFDKADVRLSPRGLIVDGDDKQWEIELPGDGRDVRMATFHESIVKGTPLPADGRWGKATQEVLVAAQQSAEQRKEIMLTQQVPVVDGTSEKQAARV